MKMQQLKNKFNLMLTGLSVVALLFVSSCGSDDPAPAVTISFSSTTASVMESGDPLTVTVNFSGVSGAAGTFTATVSGDAVYTDDYTTDPDGSSGSISFTVAEGDATKTFTLTPVNNDEFTGDKTVTFTLSAATGVDLGTDASITVTITDDETEPTTIADLRTNFATNGASTLGSDVIIEGVVTSSIDNITGKNIYVQDATAGIVVRFVEDNETFTLGDQIRINASGASLGDFNGLVQVSDVPNASAMKTGDGTLPTPEMITITQLLTDDFQGKVVTLTDVAFDNADGTATYNGSQGISDAAGNETSTFVRSDAAFSGDVLPAGVGTITGIASSFGNTPQIDLRTAADVSVTASATITVDAANVADFGDLATDAVSSNQTYTVTGSGLLADVAIAVPDHFEASLEAEANFGTALTIPMADAMAGAVTVYVRFAPTSGFAGVQSGDITHSSFSALGQNVSVSGTETVEVVTTVLFDENFDYGTTAGDLTTLTTNWVKSSGTAPLGYNTTSLSMTGYGSSGVGGSVSLIDPDGSAEDASRTFVKQSSGSVYVSALVSLASFNEGGDDYFFHLRDEGGAFFARLHAKDDGSGGLNFGISEGSTSSSTLNYSTTTYAYATTYLLVIKYDFTAGEASLYVLDNAATTEPGSADASSNDGTDPGDLDKVGIRQGNNTPVGTIDGVRAATDWAGVIGLE